MKKKLLSLVLAGAMVASTSVSAFADTTIKKSDTEEPTTDITITGKVLDQSNNEAAGTFNVTVPTAASFTVNSEAKVTSATMKIVNNGPQDIDVYAEKFVDTTPNSGEQITVVRESDLKSQNRSYVSLNIRGKSGALYLKSEETNGTNKKGLYTNNTLENAAEGEALKLTRISSGDEGDLVLEGKAGEENSTQPSATNNDFTLTLKIKKSTTN